jgi:small nuclear ribonucleoprotein (snRNP)-like protein
MRLSLRDRRLLLGRFSAYNKFGNFVLTGVEEIFGDQKRAMPMVIARLAFITATAIDPSVDPPAPFAET